MKSLLKSWNKLPRIVKAIVYFCIVFAFYYFFFLRNTIEKFSNPQKCTYYYWNKCGYCKQFDPEWDKFQKSYNGSVILSKKEMSEAGPELKKYNINAFPTIIIVDDTGDFKQYEGPRTSSGLLQYFSN
tara:strand:- start:1142 stop:1525 length:384 start_codon:yes stop_codon:yes gene_type:complete